LNASVILHCFLVDVVATAETGWLINGNDSLSKHPELAAFDRYSIMPLSNMRVNKVSVSYLTMYSAKRIRKSR